MTITSVQPVPAAPASGWEIAVPFHIDPATGGVAVLTQELAIINQHLVSIIFTIVGERLMLPTYGTTVPNQVFEGNSGVLVAFLEQDLKKAIQVWEPSITVQRVFSNPDFTTPSTINIQVDYTVQPFTNQNTVSVNVGWSVQQVVSI